VKPRKSFETTRRKGNLREGDAWKNDENFCYHAKYRSVTEVTLAAAGGRPRKLNGKAETWVDPAAYLKGRGAGEKKILIVQIALGDWLRASWIGMLKNARGSALDLKEKEGTDEGKFFMVTVLKGTRNGA